MKKLPVGVYAVSESFQEGTVIFTFKQETYEATVGENAFCCLEELVLQTLLPAKEPFCGYSGIPVVLMVAGLCRIGNRGTTRETRFRTYFPCAAAILGENAGVSPNGEDLRIPAPRGEESVIEGSYYYGTIALRGEVAGCMTIDGITLRTKIYDERIGGENASLVVKNCIIESPLSYNLIYVAPDFSGSRSASIADCRVDGLNSMQGEGNLICVCSGKLTVERLYMTNTGKFLGMSNYARTIINHVSHVQIKDSLFEHCTSTNGLSVCLPEDAKALLEIENCRFLNFVPKGEPVITAMIPAGSTLKVIDSQFVGESDGPAVLIVGDCTDVYCEGSAQEGFSQLCAPKAPRRTAVDTEKRYLLEDPHSALPDENFGILDTLYEGKQLYFGDFHCHSDSGGTSDGKTPLAAYVPRMKELNMDFAAIVDHKQMRHFFLPEWDERYLICGMEPGTTLEIPERPLEARQLHYTMIFPDKTGLAQVFDAFPEFRFTGTWEGYCCYPRFTMERFRELAEYVYNIGGILSHAHPKQVMISEKAMDYYISELVPLETVHEAAASFATKLNRDLWVSILNNGKRVRTHGSTDAHGPVSNRGMTAVYSPRHFSTDIFKEIRAGNCVAGGVGIQMAIDHTPMGGVADYAEGIRLYIRVNAFHPAHWQANTIYCLKVYTDKGLAFAKEFDTMPLSLALPVENRTYYRAEITNESDHTIVAITNPIWLNRA